MWLIVVTKKKKNHVLLGDKKDRKKITKSHSLKKLKYYDQI